MFPQNTQRGGEVKAVGKRVLAISNGEGFLLREGQGGYSLLPYFESDSLFYANSVSVNLPDIGEVTIIGAFERLPLPFGGLRYFEKEEANSLLIDPASRVLLRLCLAFKPLLLGEKRVHPLSPDDEKGYRGLIKRLSKQGERRENIRAIKALSRYECGYRRLYLAASMLGEKDDDQETA